jgi:carboxyl-terminal processing protease
MKFILIIPLFVSNITNAGELDEIKSIIDKYYVKEVTQHELEKSAVKGIISALDPHTNYIEKDEFTQIYEMMQDAYAGLGIEIILSNGYPLILSVTDGTPGAKKGLKSGDIITKADGIKLYGLSIKDIRDAIKGKVGTNAKLTILRNNQEIEFNIVREKIKIESSHVKLMDDIAYVRIKHFSKDVGQNIKNAYETLDQNNINGVVLDMRYNPGGLLDEAVNVASLFLEKQATIVSIKGRNTEITREFVADGATIANGIPIVIIINATSASAAEIVAGALQDHKRGQVVGTKSFGKGSVQTTFSLRNGDVIKLTTALYYTPNGHAIQGNGVLPNVVVEDEMVLEKISSIAEFSENSLHNRLSDDLFEKNNHITKPQLYRSKVIGDAARDFQLIRAIDVIRTMNFYKYH